jgi:hypothetical protein
VLHQLLAADARLDQRHDSSLPGDRDIWMARTVPDRRRAHTRPPAGTATDALSGAVGSRTMRSRSGGVSDPPDQGRRPKNAPRRGVAHAPAPFARCDLTRALGRHNAPPQPWDWPIPRRTQHARRASLAAIVITYIEPLSRPHDLASSARQKGETIHLRGSVPPFVPLDLLTPWPPRGRDADMDGPARASLAGPFAGHCHPRARRDDVRHERRVVAQPTATEASVQAGRRPSAEPSSNQGGVGRARRPQSGDAGLDAIHDAERKATQQLAARVVVKPRPCVRDPSDWELGRIDLLTERDGCGRTAFRVSRAPSPLLLRSLRGGIQARGPRPAAGWMRRRASDHESVSAVPGSTRSIRARISSAQAASASGSTS